jgi:hypothetical protein
MGQAPWRGAGRRLNVWVYAGFAINLASALGVGQPQRVVMNEEGGPARLRNEKLTT